MKVSTSSSAHKEKQRELSNEETLAAQCMSRPLFSNMPRRNPIEPSRSLITKSNPIKPATPNIPAKDKTVRLRESTESENANKKIKPTLLVKPYSTDVPFDVKKHKEALKHLISKGWKTYQDTHNGRMVNVTIAPRKHGKFDTSTAIENLEYFTSDEALHAHIQHNKSLLNEWKSLWYTLNQCNGWVGDSYSDGEGSTGAAFVEDNPPFVHQYSFDSLDGDTVEGMHVFNSHDQFYAYLQRFPFLLATDVEIDATLQLHDWKCRTDRNGKEYDWEGCADPRWRSLKNTKQLLWRSPHLLFRHYAIDKSSLSNFFVDETPKLPDSSSTATPNRFVPVSIVPPMLTSGVSSSSAINNNTNLSDNNSTSSSSSSSSSIGNVPIKEEMLEVSADALSTEGSTNSKSPTTLDNIKFLRINGPSNCHQYFENFIQNQARRSDGASTSMTGDRKDKESMFRDEKWSKILKASSFGDTTKIPWKRVHLQLNGFILNGYHEDLYIVPRTGKQSHIKPNRMQDLYIENLEYFHHSESVKAHLERNPCLLMNFTDLWEKLSAAGWVKTADGCYEYPRALEFVGSDGMIEGIHRFRSIKGLKCYIDKFPYLLQSDAMLKKTLEDHEWSFIGPMIHWPGVHESMKCLDNTIRVAFSRTSGMPLLRLRRLLWVYPEVLFHSYYINGDLTLKKIHDAICYTADEPSSVEPEAPVTEPVTETVTEPATETAASISEASIVLTTVDGQGKSNGQSVVAAQSTLEVPSELATGSDAMVVDNQVECTMPNGDGNDSDDLRSIPDDQSINDDASSIGDENREAVLMNLTQSYIRSLQNNGILKNEDNQFGLLQSLLDLVNNHVNVNTRTVSSDGNVDSIVVDTGVVGDPLLEELRQIHLQSAERIDVPRWAQVIMELMLQRK